MTTKTNRRTDRLAQLLQWEKVERALAAYHQTVNESRERTAAAADVKPMIRRTR